MPQHSLTTVECVGCGATLQCKLSTDNTHRQPVYCGGETGCGTWTGCPTCSRQHFQPQDRMRMCTMFGKGVSRKPTDEAAVLAARKCTCPKRARFEDKIRCPVHGRSMRNAPRGVGRSRPVQTAHARQRGF